ncbi:hypothetical protein ElyMa_006071800 [Elysia marginata]|uniref:Uncharacterized protein n=1 Tax=Elysia marginata TaxID=1093978 RepID=A0AAV4GND7_9GAST|nr:hypothetical protein ElyMa_006071800 [Elysia marginata]
MFLTTLPMISDRFVVVGLHSFFGIVGKRVDFGVAGKHRSVRKPVIQPNTLLLIPYGLRLTEGDVWDRGKTLCKDRYIVSTGLPPFSIPTLKKQCYALETLQKSVLIVE